MSNNSTTIKTWIYTNMFDSIIFNYCTYRDISGRSIHRYRHLIDKSKYLIQTRLKSSKVRPPHMRYGSPDWYHVIYTYPDHHWKLSLRGVKFLIHGASSLTFTLHLQYNLFNDFNTDILICMNNSQYCDKATSRHNGYRLCKIIHDVQHKNTSNVTKLRSVV
jgi:hypothetical protein